jgi:hypothetical protein
MRNPNKIGGDRSVAFDAAALEQPYRGDHRFRRAQRLGELLIGCRGSAVQKSNVDRYRARMERT